MSSLADAHMNFFIGVNLSQLLGIIGVLFDSNRVRVYSFIVHAAMVQLENNETIRLTLKPFKTLSYKRSKLVDV